MADFSDISLKFAHTKCFGEEPQGFGTIKPFNIIIGRNNSGKSTLLDLFPNLTHHKMNLEAKLFRSPTEPPKPCITMTLTEELIGKGFQSNIRSGIYGGRFSNDFDFGNRILKGKRATFAYSPGSGRQFNCIELTDMDEVPLPVVQHHQDRLFEEISKCFQNPFGGLTFHRISPDRSLEAEEDGPSKVMGNGDGATNEIQRFLNKAHLPRELVSVGLLTQLNQIFAPEAWFEQILARQLESNKWEIYLEEARKGLIPLSSSGHGLQTVILVLVHTMLKSHGEDLGRHIFGFEELENNLHPALFRRLLSYLKSLAISSGATFFLTTHSHVAIDMFRRDEDAQIIHVTHDGEEAKCRTLTTYVEHGDVLDDLDVRASDVLQSNCVIWVEGPTDRIYLNHWIEIASQGSLEEGVHYQCVIYGGRLLSHLSGANPETDADQAIKMLRLNRRACVVIDSDKRKRTARINDTKKRIRDEIESMDGIAWITSCKEIENYLRPEVVKQAWSLPKTPIYNEFDDVFDSIDDVKAGEGKRARDNKMRLAERAIQHITVENWTYLDLEPRLSKLCEYIRTCNNIRE
ncbi:AAA family ATPase [Bremerella sp. JC770]|uniref:ATP-dependent nuclease n=1 Tax=Bremerella sp. JC770 TaxID=3232137 RepID=UPI003458601B